MKKFSMKELWIILYGLHESLPDDMVKGVKELIETLILTKDTEIKEELTKIVSIPQYKEMLIEIYDETSVDWAIKLLKQIEKK